MTLILDGLLLLVEDDFDLISGCIILFGYVLNWREEHSRCLEQIPNYKIVDYSFPCVRISITQYWHIIEMQLKRSCLLDREALSRQSDKSWHCVEKWFTRE